MKRKGFTLIELLVVVAIIALLISILLPSLGRARELAKQAVCRSNLRGIAQACHIYSNDNKEWFPVAPHAPSAATSAGSQVMGVQYVGQMGAQISISPSTTASSYNFTSVHPSRSMFLLVVGGQSTVKQFVCPSAGDNEDSLRNQGAAGLVAAQPGINRFDFQGYSFESYGYIMPYGRFARPRTDLDPRMPLGADKSPYTQQGTPRSDTTVPDALVTPLPTIPSWWSDLQQVLRAGNDQWRSFNSKNHGGEGQVIMYSDGHADFERRPIVGVNNDNIYTYTEVTQVNNQLAAMTGRWPQSATDNNGPGTDTDAFIVP